MRITDLVGTLLVRLVRRMTLGLEIREDFDALAHTVLLNAKAVQLCSCCINLNQLASRFAPIP